MSDAGPENYRVLHIAQKLPGGVGAYLSEVLSFQREVDHHDGVFLDDADQHDDADKGVQTEVDVEDEQGQ